MTTCPKVTVLMAVYNGEAYLKEAIDSIITQTYTDYEFIIINDGSTDATESIILSYQDKRIRYIKNEINLRLIASLNRGLNLAKGKYIARMDADDIALPKRLEKQVAFLDKNSKVGLLGTWVRTTGLDKNYDVRFEQGHDKIRIRLFFNNYIHHPTVMMRSDVLKENDLEYPAVLHAEDYALWLAMSKYTKVDILPEILLYYRIHESNISKINEAFQQNQTSLLRLEQLADLGVLLDQSTIEIYNEFIDFSTVKDLESFEKLLALLENIINSCGRTLNRKELKKMINTKISNVLEIASTDRESYVTLYKKSAMSPSHYQKLKNRLKCLWKV